MPAPHREKPHWARTSCYGRPAKANARHSQSRGRKRKAGNTIVKPRVRAAGLARGADSRRRPARSAPENPQRGPSSSPSHTSWCGGASGEEAGSSNSPACGSAVPREEGRGAPHSCSARQSPSAPPPGKPARRALENPLEPGPSPAPHTSWCGGGCGRRGAGVWSEVPTSRWNNDANAEQWSRWTSCWRWRLAKVPRRSRPGPHELRRSCPLLNPARRCAPPPGRGGRGLAGQAKRIVVG